MSDDNPSEVAHKKGEPHVENDYGPKCQESGLPAQESHGAGNKPDGIEPEKRSEAEQKTKSNLEVYSLVSNTVIAVAAVAGIIFSSVQVQVAMRANTLTQRSVEATERALDISREGTIAANRAWIIVTDVAKLDIVTSTPQASINIKNAGNSPAMIEHYWVNRILRAGGPHRPDHVREGPQHYGSSVAVIGPGDTLPVTGDLVPISPSNAAMIFGKSATLFFVGSFEYSDPFGKDRMTDFCFYWTPNDWVACPGGQTFK